MTYGFRLLTASGNEFLGVDESTYMYWGKVTVSGTDVITPFNLPTSIPIEVYYYCNQTDVFMKKGQSSFLHTLEVIRGNTEIPISNTATGTAYIFVRPSDIPIESYGLALYKENGSLQWHSSRPPMSFSHTATVNATRLSSNNVGAISAIPITNLGHSAEAEPNNKTNLWFTNLASSSYGGVNTVSVVGEFISLEDTPQIYHTTPLGAIIRVGCITTSYFDSISNIANYQ